MDKTNSHVQEKRTKASEEKVKYRRHTDKLLRTLFDISYAVNTTHDLNELFQIIYDSLNRLMNLPNFYIALYYEKDDMIHFPFYVDEKDQDLFVDRVFLDGKSLTSEVILKKEALFLNQADIKKRWEEKTIVGTMPRVWMGVPLMMRQKVIGMVAIQSYTDPDYFNKDDMDILVSVSNHIALAIERKRSLNERDILEKYLYNIINSMPSILVGVDTKFHITQWNDRAEQETLVNKKDAIGKNLYDLFPRLSIFHEIINNSMELNKIQTRLRQRHELKNEIHYEDVIVYPVSTSQVDGVVIRVDDITEQIHLEEVMIQTEKMMSIGGLAAGMAHEINNPLAVIMQNAQILMDCIVLDSPKNLKVARELDIGMDDIRYYAKKRDLLKRLAAINSSCSRASKIIRNMLSFARKSENQMEPVNLSKLLQQTIHFAQNDYHFKHIRIEEDYDPTGPYAVCDKNKIQQVLLNILKNGAQAMSQPTAISFKPCFKLKTYLKENFACIVIEDNGHGIENGVKKRIFEPFYTTKPNGEGTGLGLSVSYYIIVDDHQGKLQVASVPGKGTAFTIKLPI